MTSSGSDAADQRQVAHNRHVGCQRHKVAYTLVKEIFPGQRRHLRRLEAQSQPQAVTPIFGDAATLFQQRAHLAREDRFMQHAAELLHGRLLRQQHASTRAT